MDPIDLIAEGIKSYGAEASTDVCAKLERYSQMLIEKNKVINLTAITDPAESAEKHIVDSIAIPALINLSGSRVIDVGCGAGFPGAPIKIFDRSVDITFLDSTEKKLNFIRESLESLGIDANFAYSRAEEASVKPEMREQFDFAVARAVAPMNILAELCLPFVKPGGCFIAMKSVNSDEEIKAAQNAITLLGGRAEPSVEYTLYPSGITHRLIIIKKIAPTDKKYPRRYGQIKKRPL